jgi:hypothetical protein
VFDGSVGTNRVGGSVAGSDGGGAGAASAVVGVAVVLALSLLLLQLLLWCWPLRSVWVQCVLHWYLLPLG